MVNNYLTRPRRKAWLGAAIGAVLGIGSSIFGAAKQKEAEKQQQRLQRNTELRNTGLTSAANLTQAFSNANELDEEFKSRFYKCGGRKKAEWGAEDTISLITGLGSTGSSIATNIIGHESQKANYVNAINPLKSNPKDDDAVYDSAARSNMLNDYYRVANLRCGGSKIRRR